MTELLAPPDVEAAFCVLLGGHTSVPNPRVLPFVKVTRAGGQQNNPVQTTPRLIVECWGATEAAAYTKARAAWAACRASHDSFVSGVWVGRVELTDPANFPDRDSKTPRYQFVVQPTVSLTRVEI